MEGIPVGILGHPVIYTIYFVQHIVSYICARTHISQILGGVEGTLPSIYLGMPLGAKSTSIDIWNPILEKREKKWPNKDPKFYPWEAGKL